MVRQIYGLKCIESECTSLNFTKSRLGTNAEENDLH